MNISSLGRLVTDVTEPPIWLVVAMGMAIVFAGLLCIVVVCKLIGTAFSSKKAVAPVSAAKAAATPAPKAAPASVDIPNRGAFIAAVATAIAEDLGTDVSAIRILSVKKV